MQRYFFHIRMEITNLNLTLHEINMMRRGAVQQEGESALQLQRMNNFHKITVINIANSTQLLKHYT